jgi:DMSO/TMAO reductase YedYZ molybdopterin-dependent catalytic subunit
VFDKGVFTPNDQHYVSWHWATFPSEIDVGTFRLTVRGHVNQTLSLSLDDLLHGMPRVELAAVSRCAGNSRIYMQPRVPGASRVAMLARVSVLHRFIVTASDAGIPSITGNRLE